jgi:hypothetical protein
MHGTKANMDVDMKFVDTTSQIHGSHKSVTLHRVLLYCHA